MMIIKKAQKLLFAAPVFTIGLLYLFKKLQFNVLMSSNFKYTIRSYQEKYQSSY
jgi:hypothetical protein